MKKCVTDFSPVTPNTPDRFSQSFLNQSITNAPNVRVQALIKESKHNESLNSTLNELQMNVPQTPRRNQGNISINNACDSSFNEKDVEHILEIFNLKVSECQALMEKNQEFKESYDILDKDYSSLKERYEELKSIAYCLKDKLTDRTNLLEEAYQDNFTLKTELKTLKGFTKSFGNRILKNINNIDAFNVPSADNGETFSLNLDVNHHENLNTNNNNSSSSSIQRSQVLLQECINSSINGDDRVIKNLSEIARLNSVRNLNRPNLSVCDVLSNTPSSCNNQENYSGSLPNVGEIGKPRNSTRVNTSYSRAISRTLNKIETNKAIFNVNSFC